MKKIAKLLMLCVLALSMVACTSSPTVSDDVDNNLKGTLEQELKIDNPTDFEVFKTATLTPLGEGSSLDIKSNEIIVNCVDATFNEFVGNEELKALMEDLIDVDAVINAMGGEAVFDNFKNSYPDVEGDISFTFNYLGDESDEVVLTFSFNKNGLIEDKE